MKPQEITKYTFHDSTINSIDIDDSDNKIILNLDFCNYMQDGYKTDQAEIIQIDLVFYNVKAWHADGIDLKNIKWGDKVNGSILKIDALNLPSIGLSLSIEITNYILNQDFYLKLDIYSDEVELRKV